MVKASKHIVDMQMKIQCDKPIPTVVHVKHLNRSADAVYFPECTIIHRCSDKAGCCAHGHECVAKHSENVILPFMVSEDIHCLTIFLNAR